MKKLSTALVNATSTYIAIRKSFFF